jgi:hypothetical protein
MSDNVSNCKNAAKKIRNSLENFYCLNHTIHLLLMHDVIINGHFYSIKDVLQKVKKSYNILLFKKNELKKLFFDHENKK